MKKILAKILLFTMIVLLGTSLSSLTIRADELEPESREQLLCAITRRISNNVQNFRY